MSLPHFSPVTKTLDGASTLFEHRAEPVVDVCPTQFLLCVNFQAQPDAAYSYEGRPTWRGVRQAGMAHLIEPSRRITGFVPSPTDHVVLTIDTQWLAQLALENLDADRFELVSDGLPFHDETLRRLAELLRDELVGDCNALMLDALTTAVGLHLLRTGSASSVTQPGPTSLSPRKLALSKAYLQDNFARVVRLKDLAAEVGMSADHFWRCFKNDTGLTPHEFQTRARVRYVVELLADPKASLSSASLAAGFSSQSHMTRAFRKHVGTTPARWRRERQ